MCYAAQSNFRNQARVFDAEQQAVREAKARAEAKVGKLWATKSNCMTAADTDILRSSKHQMQIDMHITLSVIQA